MECPQCKLIVPLNAEKCDCGHSFVAGSMMPLAVSAHLIQQRRTKWIWTGLASVTVCSGLIAGGLFLRDQLLPGSRMPTGAEGLYPDSPRAVVTAYLEAYYSGKCTAIAQYLLRDEYPSQRVIHLSGETVGRGETTVTSRTQECIRGREAARSRGRRPLFGRI